MIIRFTVQMINSNVQNIDIVMVNIYRYLNYYNIKKLDNLINISTVKIFFTPYVRVQI